MLIERKSIIAFDEIQERERIGFNFEGELRDKLLEVLEAFVTSDWPTAIQRVRALDRATREFLDPTIWDVLSEIARRDEGAEIARQLAEKAGRILTVSAERVLAHPVFTNLEPAWQVPQSMAGAATKERNIFVPRISVDMLLAGPLSRHSVNVVVPYRGFDISIAAAAVDTRSDLRMSTVRVYQSNQDKTMQVFGVDDSTNVDATASTLQQAFEAIDRLLAIPDIPVMEQMG